jgi:hypothetical protein
MDDMDVDYALFNPANYQISFPFFDEKESEPFTELLGRDSVVIAINENLAKRFDRDKFWPVIISTSRGMGKRSYFKRLANKSFLLI